MTTRFPCPYLQGNVELTAEREQHIAEHHPDLLPEHRSLLAAALADPDQIRRSIRFGGGRIFARWPDNLHGGKHVVVVVIIDADPQRRHWVVTADNARRLAGGDVEWTRD